MESFHDVQFALSLQFSASKSSVFGHVSAGRLLEPSAHFQSKNVFFRLYLPQIIGSLKMGLYCMYCQWFKCLMNAP